MRLSKLLDTTEMMTSPDYKERFKAEYYQLAIRYRRLQVMVINWDNRKLTFTPTCPRSTYILQLKAMEDYKAVLEARAVMEHIDL